LVLRCRACRSLGGRQDATIDGDRRPVLIHFG
jgi:hypothetical protein